MRPTTAALLALAAGLGLTGCSRPGELELRFEAERLRWRIDRAEDLLRVSSRAPFSGDVERVRELHAEVQRRFGAQDTPTDSQLRDPDALLRLRIAGASSLYGADLAAHYAPSAETVEEFDRIARFYSFDRELSVRALFGKGRVLEKLGRTDEALAASLELFARNPVVPARENGNRTIPEISDGLLDLEVHAVALAERLGAKAPPTAGETILERLAAREAQWKGTKLEPRFAHRNAEALFVHGRWSEGLAILAARRDAITDSSASGLASAEIAEILERGSHDLTGAEREYRRALAEGPRSEAEAVARLGLARVLLALRRPAEALVELDNLFKMRARELENRSGEAAFLKAKALVDLGRWEDALPAFEAVSKVDDEGNWGILSQGPAIDRLRILEIDLGARDSAREAVALAKRVPAREPPDPPFGWSGFWQAPVSAARWAETVSVLRRIATEFPEESFAAEARQEADRLERERVGPWFAPSGG